MAYQSNSISSSYSSHGHITWRKIECLCTFSFDLGLFPALEVVALGLDADACDAFPNDVGSRQWKFSSILHMLYTNMAAQL